jgi:hypothetical protein
MKNLLLLGTGRMKDTDCTTKLQTFDIPVIYKYLDPDLEESQLLAAENEYGLYGYLNLKNEVIIAFQYEHATGFRNGFAYISRFTEEDGRGIAYEGVINEKGEPFSYGI